MAPLRVCFFGAGRIGLYVGCTLATLDDVEVSFIGRQRLYDSIVANGGVELSTILRPGNVVKVPLDKFSYSTTIDEALGRLKGEAFDVIVVTVKSGATGDVAQDLRKSHSSTQIVSLQNAVENLDALRSALPGHVVVESMVPYNVAQLPSVRFHQGVTGPLFFDDRTHPRLIEGLQRAKLDVKTVSESEMRAVLHGKLVVNLNNSLNAISGMPLKQQFLDWNYRWIWATMQQELLAVFEAKGIRSRPFVPLPIWVVPLILKLPTPVYRALAGSMLALDDNARSSMWDDLEAGRTTELDHLNGHAIRLAEEVGLKVPVISAVYAMVKELESKHLKSPCIPGDVLLATLREKCPGAI